ncbi:MAG: hypothetical protein U0L88_07570 [Acutalibacteraceae bacterium]|nr:hypothetical protein [Acutalibacteraceae bacterium]
MKHIDWNNVEEAKGFEKLPAGGYICGITAVEDVPDKEYLKFEFDIADGPHKNEFRALYDAKGFWGASFVKSYKEKARGFFKKMLVAFEKSNSSFVFNDDEKIFKRKLIGLVLGYEEYTANDGSVKQRLIVTDWLPVADIKAGNFTIPKLKTLYGEEKDKLAELKQIVEDDTDDLPFD